MKNNQRAAQLAGERLYDTGKPCKRGHLAARRAHNGNCVRCEQLYQKQRYNKREVFLIDLGHTYTNARREAEFSGSPTYFTGRPCCKGHTAPRRTNNGTCVVCRNKTEAARYAKRRAAEGVSV